MNAEGEAEWTWTVPDGTRAGEATATVAATVGGRTITTTGAFAIE